MSKATETNVGEGGTVKSRRKEADEMFLKFIVLCHSFYRTRNDFFPSLLLFRQFFKNKIVRIWLSTVEIQTKSFFDVFVFVLVSFVLRIVRFVFSAQYKNTLSSQILLLFFRIFLGICYQLRMNAHSHMHIRTYTHKSNTIQKQATFYFMEVVKNKHTLQHCKTNFHHSLVQLHFVPKGHYRPKTTTTTR